MVYLSCKIYFVGVLLFENHTEGSLTLQNSTGKEIVGLIQRLWQEVCTPGHESAFHLYRVRA